jgi:hypothetical protein
MASLVDESGEVRWRAVLERLGSGSVVGIPCLSERDFVRRAAQATKRAEKGGLEVKVERTPDSIRIVPSVTGSAAAARGGSRRDARDGKTPRQARSRKAVAARG